MTSYRIDCPEIDSDLAGERFPSRVEAECVAAWIGDMEEFLHLDVVEVEGEPTITAAEYLDAAGDLNYPGPPPAGVEWSEWIYQHN